MGKISCSCFGSFTWGWFYFWSFCSRNASITKWQPMVSNRTRTLEGAAEFTFNFDSNDSNGTAVDVSTKITLYFHFHSANINSELSAQQTSNFPPNWVK